MDRRMQRRTATAALLALSAVVVLTSPVGRDATLLALVAAYALCAAIVWFAGIRALVLWALSRRAARRAAGIAVAPASGPGMRVALLYCTADDLDEDALHASMRQSTAVDTVILDDSRDPAMRRRVDAFAAEHLAQVVRRPQRTGYKAGNLNHALAALRGRYDAYVVLDSDTRLPRGFAAAASAVLSSDPRVACVQGVPDAGGSSAFARLFGPLVRGHATGNHLPRGIAGFPLFCGRGAMLSARALDAVGGFPEAVAEDLALSVRLRGEGWRIVHRPDLVFGEAFPIDYAAFRTQAAKTAEGVAQFLRTARLARRRVPLRERLDALVEAALLPVGAVAGLAIAVGGSLLGAIGHPAPAAVVAVTALLALAPLAPGALLQARRNGAGAGLLFAVAASALYASVAVLTVRHAWAVARGRRAVFAITPKTGRRMRLREAVTAARVDILSALALAAIALIVGMPALALPLALPAATAVALLVAGPVAPARSLVGGRRIRPSRTAKRDAVLTN